MIVIDDSSWFDRLSEWFAQAWTDDEIVEDQTPEAMEEDEEEPV